MAIDDKLTDEQARVAALHRYEVMDVPVEEPFDRITKLVQMVLGVPIAQVSLIDRDRQWPLSCVGTNRDGVPRELSFCHFTIQGREPMNIPDATKDERFSSNPFVADPNGVRSYLGVPLATPDGYNIGSLCAADMRPRDFSNEQVEVLKSFAKLVVDEMELRRIAQTDHLTGAHTRRGFTLEMDKQISRVKRSGRPSTLLLLDVDHFKKVNDTYGHPAGDAVLRNMAERLQRRLRKGDLLGRLGGEEFGILLPDTGLEAALEFAERIRQAIAYEPLVQEPQLAITISLGLAATPGSGGPDHWLAAADKALYEAKRSGRNRTCVA